MRTRGVDETKVAQSPKGGKLFCSRPYVTFNPELFDNIEVWSRRDLQELCEKLQLGTCGKRQVLLEKLYDWHRTNDHQEKDGPGQNFALLGIKVPVSPAKAPTSAKKRPPTSSNREFLSPLKVRNKLDSNGTPSSILRRKSKYSPHNSQRSSRKSIAFSPYNGVQLIPARKRIRYDEDDE